MKTPRAIAADVYWAISEFPTEPTGKDLRRIMTAAIEADRAQRADEMHLPEPWDATLRIIEGDGEEYTDTVAIRFTRSWDSGLTREHTVSWETFVKALAVIAREEA